MILKIVMPDGSSQRLTLSYGLPASIDDLRVEVKKQCGLRSDFKLEFMDSLFGNEFLNLTSMSEVKDKGTLRVTELLRPTTSQYEGSSAVGLDPQVLSPFSVHSDSSSLSGSTVDTDILSSSPESTSSKSLWPAMFHVPKFSYDAEIKLQRANLAYQTDGTVLFPIPN